MKDTGVRRRHSKLPMGIRRGASAGRDEADSGLVKVEKIVYEKDIHHGDDVRDGSGGGDESRR